MGPLIIRSLAIALVLVGQVGATELAQRRADIIAAQQAIETNSAGLEDADRLNTLIDLYFQYTMLEFPEFATYIGHPDGNDRWTDNSREAVLRREADARDALRIISSIDRAKLSGVDRLNYDLLRNQLQDSIDGQRFGGNYLQISQLGGPQQDLSQVLSLMPTRNTRDYANILSRLRAVPKQIDDAIGWMRAGLDAGVTPPRITLRDVPLQVENQIVEDALDSPLLVPFTRWPPSMDEAARIRLTSEAVAAYDQNVRPAFQRLLDFLVDEYIPAARESIAMSALPNGQAWYAYNVRQQTTTALTPREIHEIGLSEVQRIRAEMESIKQRTGFEGDLQAFFDFLRTDPQFFFSDETELLAAYRDIAKRADPALIKVFGKLPTTPYGVEPVPEYAEQSQTTAYYMPGSLEAGRPGTFYANTYALNTRPKWEMEALTLHEAVPGHHLQIALQQELKGLAWFRRFGGYTAFIEGWGLYSESLGVEMGFYTDPYSKFGQLTYEMWRAIRLVVDTGMHALGWSRQQAIEFFKANTGKTEHDIVVEVDRYIVVPGQALAYKIGELKIKELRARAKERQGEAFDLRAFHDALLGQGSLPLTVLEQHMDDWMATRP